MHFNQIERNQLSQMTQVKRIIRVIKKPVSQQFSTDTFQNSIPVKSPLRIDINENPIYSISQNAFVADINQRKEQKSELCSENLSPQTNFSQNPTSQTNYTQKERIPPSCRNKKIVQAPKKTIEYYDQPTTNLRIQNERDKLLINRNSLPKKQHLSIEINTSSDDSNKEFIPITTEKVRIKQKSQLRTLPENEICSVQRRLIDNKSFEEHSNHLNKKMNQQSDSFENIFEEPASISTNPVEVPITEQNSIPKSIQLIDFKLDTYQVEWEFPFIFQYNSIISKPQPSIYSFEQIKKIGGRVFMEFLEKQYFELQKQKQSNELGVNHKNQIGSEGKVNESSNSTVQLVKPEEFQQEKNNCTSDSSEQLTGFPPALIKKRFIDQNNYEIIAHQDLSENERNDQLNSQVGDINGFEKDVINSNLLEENNFSINIEENTNNDTNNNAQISDENLIKDQKSIQNQSEQNVLSQVSKDNQENQQQSFTNIQIFGQECIDNDHQQIEQAKEQYQSSQQQQQQQQHQLSPPESQQSLKTSPQTSEITYKNFSNFHGKKLNIIQQLILSQEDDEDDIDQQDQKSSFEKAKILVETSIDQQMEVENEEGKLSNQSQEKKEKNKGEETKQVQMRENYQLFDPVIEDEEDQNKRQKNLVVQNDSVHDQLEMNTIDCSVEQMHPPPINSEIEIEEKSQKDLNKEENLLSLNNNTKKQEVVSGLEQESEFKKNILLNDVV